MTLILHVDGRVTVRKGRSAVVYDSPKALVRACMDRLHRGLPDPEALSALLPGFPWPRPTPATKAWRRALASCPSPCTTHDLARLLRNTAVHDALHALGVPLGAGVAFALSTLKPRWGDIAVLTTHDRRIAVVALSPA